VSEQPAYPVFCFEGQKVLYPVSSFVPDIKLSWRNLTTVNMVEWQVTRQSSDHSYQRIGYWKSWCGNRTVTRKSSI